MKENIIIIDDCFPSRDVRLTGNHSAEIASNLSRRLIIKPALVCHRSVTSRKWVVIVDLISLMIKTAI